MKSAGGGLRRSGGFSLLAHCDYHHDMKKLSVTVLVLVFLCSVAQARQSFNLENGKWQAKNTYPENSPQGQIQAIQNQLADNHGEQAEEMAEKWIKAYPDNALMPEALLLLGDAKTMQAYYYDALYDYEKVIRKYPGSDQFMMALRREYKTAKLFVNGTRRLFLGLRIIPAYGDGEEILIRIQQRAPGSAIGEKASMTLADYYFRDKQMEKAAIAYDSFIKNYPNSPQRKVALHQLIKSNLARYRGDEFDPTGLLNAQQRLGIYQQQYPVSAKKQGTKKKLADVTNELGQAALVSAMWYYNQGNDVSAILMFKRVIKDHPDTPAAKTAKEKLKSMNQVLVAKVPG